MTPLMGILTAKRLWIIKNKELNLLINKENFSATGCDNPFFRTTIALK
jgi:hypothetical protein